jgi:hypothetical protein
VRLVYKHESLIEKSKEDEKFEEQISIHMNPYKHGCSNHTESEIQSDNKDLEERHPILCQVTVLENGTTNLSQEQSKHAYFKKNSSFLYI